MGSPQFPIDPTIWESARSQAKTRAAEHWNRWTMDRASANMWEVEPDFSVSPAVAGTINQDWIDPWFEHEYSGANTNNGPEYEITQNLYYMYCWLSWKGYNKYSIMSMMASAIQESRISGGQWEAGNHPYGDIKTFNSGSLSTYGVPSNYQFIANWPHVWHNAANGLVSYTASAFDPLKIDTDHPTGQNVYLNCSGTWAAVKRFPIAMHQVEVDGVTYIRPVYNSAGEPVLDITAPQNLADGRGYGLVQWTPWTKLPATYAHAYLVDNKDEFNRANTNWQLNLTLTMMLLEYEREVAMSGIPQTGGSYYGQWVDSNAASNSDYGAYFQYPYNPSSPYNRHYYNQPCTWNDFRDGVYLQWFDDYIANMSNPPTGTDVDWCRRQLALGIWRSCFIQTVYADFDFEARTLYVLSAIEYWDANGGWDVVDIPRARDIPNCELDQFHMSTELLLYTVRRRKKKNVRTVLL